MGVYNYAENEAKIGTYEAKAVLVIMTGYVCHWRVMSLPW